MSKNLRVVVCDFCNYKCVGCFNEWFISKCSIFADTEKIINIVTAIDPIPQTIKITGGEPFLHKDICKIANTFSEISKTTITTNSTNLNKNLQYLNSSIDITISIKSLERLRFKNLCRVGDDEYNKFIQEVNLVKYYNNRNVYANIVISDDIYIDYHKELLCLIEKGFKKVRYIQKLGKIQKPAVYEENIHRIMDILKCQESIVNDDPTIYSCRYCSIILEYIIQFTEFEKNVREKFDFIWLYPNGVISQGYDFGVFKQDWQNE
ncbi:hypothetical protein TRIP_E160201 [uncultured Spirochaetota bacterium]|nr:hypothetical protein TRIP_E160201 [uncultured Spirochaetota bacterium]